jgi:biopolymer transport protein ExbD
VNLQQRPRDEPEVNLTSLIDVVLLLLVFFMVSTSFVKRAELNVMLPQTSQESVTEKPPLTVEITVTAEGAYYVEDRALINSDPDTLRRAIEDVAGKNRKIPVTIRADAQATHQSVVTAMDVAGRLGFVHINIATMSDQQ